jgi:hypothetical protein
MIHNNPDRSSFGRVGTFRPGQRRPSRYRRSRHGGSRDRLLPFAGAKDDTRVTVRQPMEIVTEVPPRSGQLEVTAEP